MLVLEPKVNQKIILKDSISGAVVNIKSFLRNNGNIALGFDAPRTVKITRERVEKNDGKAKK